ncbi:hypothetical protein ANCCAN_20644 [Ancylostoma caninum]|uniref:Uncharacterized protein n=1 Tax=Ancylostoma caninum TaxID=29170 RepID=A0A368FN11_ANCCA|nr:hypothetical protein ANCCAN_20644 [Ancylostoma caninum]
MCRTKPEITNLIAQFYEELINVTYTPLPVENECPPFLESEVNAALRTMKAGRTAGHDGVTEEMLKWA